MLISESSVMPMDVLMHKTVTQQFSQSFIKSLFGSACKAQAHLSSFEHPPTLLFSHSPFLNCEMRPNLRSTLNPILFASVVQTESTGEIWCLLFARQQAKKQI